MTVVRIEEETFHCLPDQLEELQMKLIRHGWNILRITQSKDGKDIEIQCIKEIK